MERERRRQTDTAVSHDGFQMKQKVSMQNMIKCGWDVCNNRCLSVCVCVHVKGHEKEGHDEKRL